MAAETARFGINDEGVHLDMPQSVVDVLVGGEDHALGKLLGIKNRDRAFDFSRIDRGWSLQLLPEKLGTMTDVRRGNALKDIVRVIQLIENKAPAGGMDPRLDLLMGIEKSNLSGNFTMVAGAKWPTDIDDGDLEEKVTEAMVHAANGMKYQHPDRVDVNVTATIDRPAGVQLDTNWSQRPVGLLSTDGVRPYRPEAPTVELEAYTLETRQQQVIALHGLVAFIEGGR